MSDWGNLTSFSLSSSPAKVKKIAFSREKGVPGAARRGPNAGGNRDLGVTFKVHPGSQASSRVEAKNSALFSNYDGYLLESIQWPEGCQASCGVLRKDWGLLSRPCRKIGASSHESGLISW